MAHTAKNILKIVLISLCCVGSLFAHDNPTKAQQIKQYLSIANKAYHRKNYDKALKYFQKAADLGSAKGYIGLGDLHSDYDSGFNDYAQALFYYKKAGDLGSAEAYFNLGYLYNVGGDCDRFGCAVKPDNKKALQYFKKAGDMGYAAGYVDAGLMYEGDEDIPKDYAKAMQYYQKAADMGNSAAYTNLGIMYAHGKGVKPDKEKARQYYQKACNMGFDTSCWLLKELKHKNKP
ncbi:tetratricopeptide repeat protein [Helicobacter bizzozeronii]|uniref:tetratricopeptide repeat protein n=1 Tax=Helicobacter bizzozeronii TaxID=56877 RepID=UPI000CF05AEE|nr:tetratricopeptide repeat protein [Helicobacter bizzozeronii]